MAKEEVQLSDKDIKLQMLRNTLTNGPKKGKNETINISFLNEVGLNENVDAFSTGSLSVDIATGVGGIPRGRITEIYGPESSGKTTLTLHAIADAQKKGGIAAFVDAEHALDPEYASNIGVNTDELLFSQPESGEAGLQTVEMLIRSKAVDIVVVDSVAALTPRAELNGEIGDSHVGLQARLMSQTLRKLTGITAQTNTSVVFINQLREKVGVFFGSPETTSGGKALKFYASMRLDVRRIGSKKENGQAISNETKVKVVKNKVAPPFKEARADIVFGQGFSRELDVLQLGIDHNIVKKAGSWISYEGNQVGQGLVKAAETLEANPAMMQEIEDKIMGKINTAKEEKKEELRKKREAANAALANSPIDTGPPLLEDADVEEMPEDEDF